MSSRLASWDGVLRPSELRTYGITGSWSITLAMRRTIIYHVSCRRLGLLGCLHITKYFVDKQQRGQTVVFCLEAQAGHMTAKPHTPIILRIPLPNQNASVIPRANAFDSRRVNDAI